MFEKLNLPKTYWVPEVCDYYRFVLTRPEIDGILCSPLQPEEMRQLAQALAKGPLTPDQEQYMIRLSSMVHAQVLT